MDQRAAVNFFEKEVYTELALVSLQVGDGVLGIAFCPLMPDDKLTCAVAAEKIFQYSLGYTLAVKIFLVWHHKLHGAVEVYRQTRGAAGAESDRDARRYTRLLLYGARNSHENKQQACNK